MGRRPNPQRKRDLLDEIVVYLGETGIGDLSLRPLAKCLGTSTYTLTYQFGSKDQLVMDAVSHAVELRNQSVAELAEDGTATPAEFVRRLWAWSTHPPNLRLVRMLLEATTLAHTQPAVFGDVGRQVVAEGVGLLAGAVERAGAGPVEATRVATQAYGTIVGLQMDLMATGERQRVDLAVEELCRALDRELAGAAEDDGEVLDLDELGSELAGQPASA
jgi:AcrR family transcriptional regulator